MAQLGLALAVTAVLGLLLAVVWLLRGRPALRSMAPWTAQQEDPRELRRLAGIVLTAQHTIHAVEWRGRRMLIATGPGVVALIDRETGDFTREYTRALAGPAEASERGGQ
jgi:hypothetical protein